jgi:hypothetical protein
VRVTWHSIVCCVSRTPRSAMSASARRGDRDGPPAPPATGLLDLRPARRSDPQPARQALASSGSGRPSLRDRVRAARATLPGLRRALRGQCRGFEQTAPPRAISKSRGMAGAADGHQADRRHAADRVGLRQPKSSPRVVADHLDDTRLTGLVAIGCDDISCAPQRRHQSGGIRGPPPVAAMAG